VRSPGADRLAVAGTDGALRVWDLASRTRVQVLRSELHLRTGHEAAVVALAFSPDGALLASGHVDGACRLWAVGRGEELPVRLRHEGAAGAAAFSPGGEVLVTGGVDATLKLWDVRAAIAGEARRELLRQPAGVTSVAFAAAGRLLVTGHVNRVVRVLDAPTLRLAATLRGHGAAVSVLCPDPRGTRLASASPDRTLRLFDLEERRELWSVEAPRRPAAALAFADEGRVLMSVALDNALSLWDLDASTPLATLWGGRDEAFVGVATLTGDDGVAAALADGRLRLWGVAG
jgi:WD40 repeat protein